MVEHTPRPWMVVSRYEFYTAGRRWFALASSMPMGFVVAVDCEGRDRPSWSQDIEFENAMLMAQAPDLLRQRDALLAALEGLYKASDEHLQFALEHALEVGRLATAMVNAQKAIALVRGGTEEVRG